MAAALSVNGIPLRPLNQKQSRRLDVKGNASWSANGFFHKDKIGPRKAFSLSSGYHGYQEGLVLTAIINGEGQLFNFDTGLESTKNLQPVAGYSGVQFFPATAGAYGVSGYIELNGRLIYDCQLEDTWTIFWHEGANFDQWALRSDGQAFLNGLATASSPAVTVTVNEGAVSLDTVAATELDHLLVFPHEVPNNMIGGFGLQAWPALPYVEFTGTLLKRSITGLGAAGSETVQHRDCDAGSWNNDGMRVDFEVWDIDPSFLEDVGAQVRVQTSGALGIDNIPDADITINAPFSYVPTITSGPPPAVTLFSGTLPAGFSLNSSTGEISGTALASELSAANNSGVFANLQLQVFDGANVVYSNIFSLNIMGVSLPAPAVYLPAEDSLFEDATLLTPNPTNNNTVVHETTTPLVDTGSAKFDATVDQDLDYGADTRFQITGVADKTFYAAVNQAAASANTAVIFDHEDATSGFNGWGLGITTGGQLIGTVRYTGTRARATAQLGTWPTGQLLGAAMDHSTSTNKVRIYQDGYQVTSLATDTTGTGSVQNDVGFPLKIGGFRAPAFEAMDGLIDEVCIWDQALTADQHATLAWLSRTGRTVGAWINGAFPSIVAIPTLNGSTGVAFSYTPSGSADIVRWIEDPNNPVPANLVVNPATGQITGLPAGPGTTSVRLFATDGLQVTRSNFFDIVVT